MNKFNFFVYLIVLSTSFIINLVLFTKSETHLEMQKTAEARLLMCQIDNQILEKDIIMCKHFKEFKNFYGEKSQTGICGLDNNFCDKIGHCRHLFYCPVCKKWFYSRNNVYKSKAKCDKCGNIVGLSK